MPLFIPTSDGSDISLSNTVLKKGQIYNMDTNEFMNFQFNPENFEWHRDIKWNESTWQGDEFGGHLQFSNVGPARFDLLLQFLADPGAPDLEYDVNNYKLHLPGDLKIDYQAIVNTIESWTAFAGERGRPAIIKIIFSSDRSFEGVFTRLNFRIDETFTDLSVKDGLIEMRFREWKRNLKSI